MSLDHNFAKKIPTPREMMRDKRPYLFSDSDIDQSHSLPRVNFEYHLETLTARKQEYEFEDFCRKLAEKELCPNLTIQTGPTGGGDSKADAETYPVAPEISERWWIGSPVAGSECGHLHSARRRIGNQSSSPTSKSLSKRADLIPSSISSQINLLPTRTSQIYKIR